MGTWGTENFGNDGACAFLDNIVEHLLSTITNSMALEKTDKSQFLDHYGEEKIMPAIDIVITLCKHYHVSPQLDLETVKGWKEMYLSIYDDAIDSHGPKEDYKIERREVILKTFVELEQIVQYWDNL